MQVSDRVTGFALVVLGLAAAYGGSRLPPVRGQQIGPDVFPMVVGIGLALCGVMVAFGIGRRFEEPAEADIVAPASDAGAKANWPWRALLGLRILLPPALLMFYVAAADRLGFIVTAAAIVLAAALAFGGALRLALPLAALAPFGVHLLFAKLLRVPLPEGLLRAPW